MQKPKLIFDTNYTSRVWDFEIANRRGGSMVVDRKTQTTLAVMVIDVHNGNSELEQLVAKSMSASLDLANCIYEATRGRAAARYYQEPGDRVGFSDVRTFVNNRWGDFLTVAEQTALMKGGFIKTERIL